MLFLFWRNHSEIIATLMDQRKKLRDLGYAYNLHTLNKKKALSFTPLNTLLKALIFALKDSLAALVALL